MAGPRRPVKRGLPVYVLGGGGAAALEEEGDDFFVSCAGRL